jgi:hypothetical protein
MRMIHYDAPEQGIIIFSTMLFWWGTIRQYYRDNNHIAVCLDMAYDTLLNNTIETNEEG